jgi:hypothetical protein
MRPRWRHPQALGSRAAAQRDAERARGSRGRPSPTDPARPRCPRPPAHALSTASPGPHARRRPRRRRASTRGRCSRPSSAPWRARPRVRASSPSLPATPCRRRGCATTGKRRGLFGGAGSAAAPTAAAACPPLPGRRGRPNFSLFLALAARPRRHATAPSFGRAAPACRAPRPASAVSKLVFEWSIELAHIKRMVADARLWNRVVEAQSPLHYFAGGRRARGAAAGTLLHVAITHTRDGGAAA